MSRFRPQGGGMTLQAGLTGVLPTLLGLFLAASLASAAGYAPQKAQPKDKCPVCGMFVAKYPNFAGQIQFRDGSALHFDGSKDLFKCLFDLPRYAKGKAQGDVAAIFVTSYYDLRPIEARSAWYVIGSDIFGPMGKELIPFPKESEAREFLKDHKGRAVLRFGDVTGAVVGSLDR